VVKLPIVSFGEGMAWAFVVFGPVLALVFAANGFWLGAVAYAVGAVISGLLLKSWPR
jgi:hypothetical protein